MKKLLVIDDDEALRGLLRRRLSGIYEVIDTGEAEQALALALEHKPDAILLDLRMPKFDGFELCRNFRSLTYTSNLPIFVVTGESCRFREECESIGITGYFEKPIDFARLKQALSASLEAMEPKAHEVTPLRMRLSLKLLGTDEHGEAFTERISTDSVARDGFQFTSPRSLGDGCELDVFLAGSVERHVGYARVVDRSAAGLELQSYRAAFDGATDWIIQ